MINKITASKKGASSILVILLLVVLVVFGIAALTTALSSLRLGQKVAEWSAEYYSVEAEASQRWAEIDKAVGQAYDKTEGGDDVTVRIAEELSGLAFDTSTEQTENTIVISYDTWEGEMGLHAALSLDIGDSTSLHATQWRQIQ